MAPRICRLPFCRLHDQFNFWPDGCAYPDSLGKTAYDDANFNLAHDHGPADLARRRCAMNESPQNAKAAQRGKTHACGISRDEPFAVAYRFSFLRANADRLRAFLSVS